MATTIKKIEKLKKNSTISNIFEKRRKMKSKIIIIIIFKNFFNKINFLCQLS